MSQLMFYEKVTPLNREQHKALHLQRAEGDCSFAATSSYVPVAGVEFPQSARDYTILFSGKGEGAVPVVVLGLSQMQNSFVGKDGKWETGCYLPAFVRRYPFVLARDGDEGKYTVCIDDSWKGFTQDKGEALFNDDGSEAGLLKQSIAFLQNFTVEMERTQDFVKRLHELELLSERDMQLTGHDGKSFMLRGFAVIDEAKLAGLDEKVVVEFHQHGYWPWVYAHLFSLSNLPRLQARC